MRKGARRAGCYAAPHEIILRALGRTREHRSAAAVISGRHIPATRGHLPALQRDYRMCCLASRTGLTL